MVSARMRRGRVASRKPFPPSSTEPAAAEAAFEVVAEEPAGDAARDAASQLRLYREIFRASSEGIAIIDLEGAYVEQNAAHRALLGYQDEELQGKTPALHLGEEVFQRIAAALAQDGAFRGEVRSQPKEGPPRDLELSAFTVRDAEGKPLCYVGIKRDVTEAKRHAAELRALNGRLQELDRMKTDLINTASHELRTPLTPIALQLEMLQSADAGALTDRQRRALQVVDRNAKRLSLLVQDMLDVARLQSGRLVVQKDPIDLTPLLQEAVASYHDAAHQAGVELVLHDPGRLAVEADGQRITQVLYNLLSNGVKFTPSGGRITVRAGAGEGHAWVRIEDTGAGLSEEQMAGLFRPFSQVHDPMQRTAGGTGLGLFISKGIIEQHAGHIGCESLGPGKGSAFWFTLPR